MDELLKYLNALPACEREPFAVRCGTTEGYIRKKCSTGGRFGEALCINFERETARTIRCEQLRPDVDWEFIRNTAPTGQRPLFAQAAGA